MIELTDEYRNAARDFRKKFGYGVPLKMVPATTTTQELIDVLQFCINSDKDILLEKLGVSINDECIY